ncbi:undecaprenyl-diphosphate phosphatase [Buchnera aphidicola (Brachycaudus cardui)]|uniref:Undecaprenyl-diphosphatase n=1 Tax=Buchnera aphidicola (Brachycaudus cardui) TaxID=557993 RepID=A0A4D6XRR1_9GAMM|nr:undecaprenyl-diphosphate phosphatase [Buchnera aphidicola]QCI20222.1 undecaprenyl-diphosphate phosphatase [Buchnera aphidicola (Brachycaudus cardui)]
MIDVYKIVTSIIIGIIEGITEFLPVSSTGHMIIASHWLGIENNNTNILEMFIQFGSSLAMLYFFREKIIKILKVKINIKNKKTNFLHIFISIVPTIFLGLIFYKQIKLLFNTNNVMYSLIFGGLFLIISEIFKPKQYRTLNLYQINFYEAIIIGLFQIFCLCPGFSRSGATIGAGVLLGIKRSVAIDFSFIISIPLLMGSSFFELINNFKNVNISEYPIFFIGFIISFIVSILCIEKLLKIINKKSLIFFAIYRFIIVGLIYLIN